MADSPNDAAQPSASDSAGDNGAAGKPATKKKTVRKAAAKKKTTKKKVTSAATAAPPPAPSASVPQWDDDQSSLGVVGTLVQWGPILLIIALILVLDSKDVNGSHVSIEPSDTAEIVAFDVLASDGSAGGAIELAENFEPWSFENSVDTSGNSALGLGETNSASNVNWLEDPAAFYWGPAIVDEFPPAPSVSDGN